MRQGQNPTTAAHGVNEAHSSSDTHTFEEQDAQTTLINEEIRLRVDEEIPLMDELITLSKEGTLLLDKQKALLDLIALETEEDKKIALLDKQKALLDKRENKIALLANLKSRFQATLTANHSLFSDSMDLLRLAIGGAGIVALCSQYLFNKDTNGDSDPSNEVCPRSGWR